MKPCLAPAALLLMALAATLAGCTSTPPTHFHSLMPVPSASPSNTALVPIARWVLLPVTVPVQVDQAPWVVRLPDGSLAVLEFERWAAPVGDEIRAALAERLREVVPAIRAPQGFRIAVDVQRLEAMPGRYARLEAEWTLRAGDSSAVQLRCRSVIEQVPAGASYPALAAAHRAAVARLADLVAAALQALDKDVKPACG